MKPPFRGHPWNKEKFPLNGGVPLLEVRTTKIVGAFQFFTTKVCLLNGGVPWMEVSQRRGGSSVVYNIRSKSVLLNVSLHVRIQKPWTQELFLECYCVARKKPIRRKMKKPQAVTVIRFVACGFWSLIWLVIAQLKCHSQIKVFTVFGFAQ